MEYLYTSVRKSWVDFLDGVKVSYFRKVGMVRDTGVVKTGRLWYLLDIVYIRFVRIIH